MRIYGGPRSWMYVHSSSLQAAGTPFLGHAGQGPSLGPPGWPDTLPAADLCHDGKSHLVPVAALRGG